MKNASDCSSFLPGEREKSEKKKKKFKKNPNTKVLWMRFRMTTLLL